MWRAYAFNSKAIRIEANLLDFFLMGFEIEPVQYMDELCINTINNTLNYKDNKYFSMEEMTISHMLSFLHEICENDSFFERINIRKLLAIKRIEYSHEKEIRIYKSVALYSDEQLQKEYWKYHNQIFGKDPVYQSNLPKYYKFPLDETSNWLKSICFHPNSNKYYQDIVKNFINKMGLKIPIKLSKLSKEPF
jgi:hypothetical protein